MVAGLAALDVIEREGLVARAAQIGDRIGEGLRALMPRYEFLKEVRWRGLACVLVLAGSLGGLARVRRLEERRRFQALR